MTIEPTTMILMRSLARAVSRGRTVTGWARSNDVSAEVALTWTELPEFRELVEKCRLDHAERMVGKISSKVGRAIERLVELSENRENLSVSFAATKALISEWINITVHFVQAQEFKSINSRIDALRNSRATAKKPGITYGTNGTIHPR